MKKIISLLFIFLTGFVFAQNINFPDINFKNFLISKGIDTGSDGEISQAEASSVTELIIDDQNITDVTGLNNFTNLQFLSFTNDSQVSNIDISSLTNLYQLEYYSGDYTGSPFKLQSLIFPPNNSNLIYLTLSTYNEYNLPYITRHYTSELNLDLSKLLNLQKVKFQGSLPINIAINTNINASKVGASNEVWLDMQPYDLNGVEKRFEVDVAQSNDKILLKNVNITYRAGATKEIAFINVNKSFAELLGFYGNYDYFVPDLPDLTSLYLENSAFIPFNPTSINNIDVLTNCPNLKSLFLINTPFEKLNLSQNTKLESFSFINYNFQAQSTDIPKYINLKNGKNLNTFNYVDGYGNQILTNPNLAICVDDINYYQNSFPLTYGYYTTNCTTTPFYRNVIKGKVLFDAANNGCTNNAVNMPLATINSTDGSYTLGTYSDNNGNYLINFPYFQNPATINTNVTTSYSGLSVAPNIDNWAVSSGGNERTVNFCVSGSIAVDADIAIASGVFRPGINSTISIYINNNSGQNITVNPTLNFDTSKFNFTSASDSGTISGNQINWNFTLAPFEVKKLLANFSIPTSVQTGDIAFFSTNLGVGYTDSNNTNNSKTIILTAVNSYDPNDKKVMEGSTVQIADKDKFLNYRINFQNTGTAEAINIVVVDNIQPNYDLSTLEVLGTSHAMRTEIIGNQVKFIFDNINLDWETHNEPASHGYVDFRIKPISTIAINDLLENKGEIYFDYNLPIITNKTNTIITNNSSLSINENIYKNIKIFPNPTKDKIYFKDLKNISKVNIYDAQGRLVKTSLSKDNYTDLSSLNKGIYLVEIFSDGKSYKTKIIKE